MRFIIIIFVSIVFLWSGTYEIELYETLFSKLFHKKIIKVYMPIKMHFHSNILQVTSCKDADIVILKNLPNKCFNKPYFVTSYMDYIHSNAIGAFYWRKSRPQLKLNAKMIKFYHLYLDKSLRKYAK